MKKNRETCSFLCIAEFLDNKVENDIIILNYGIFFKKPLPLPFFSVYMSECAKYSIFVPPFWRLKGDRHDRR